MPAFSRRNIAKALSIIGLKKTFVALRDRDTLSINRVTTPDGELKVERIATCVDATPKFIGRVGMPDPQLGIPWKNSMTFYGSWFDDLAVSDSDYRIRNSILSLSREKLLDQVRRDDKYGLIGTYYAVFLQILDDRKGLPLVLLDDSLLGLGSFPVVIPTMTDKAQEQELCELLQLFLRKEAIEASRAPRPPEAGIGVSEVTADDMSDYFSA